MVEKTSAASPWRVIWNFYQYWPTFLIKDRLFSITIVCQTRLKISFDYETTVFFFFSFLLYHLYGSSLLGFLSFVIFLDPGAPLLSTSTSNKFREIFVIIFWRSRKKKSAMDGVLCIKGITEQIMERWKIPRKGVEAYNWGLRKLENGLLEY